MYKVLPSMRRLAAEILREYGLTAYATVAEEVRSICDLVTATEQLFAMYTVTPMEKEDRSNG